MGVPNLCCHLPHPPLTPLFCQLSERYGPMFTVHLGGQKTVVLSGYEAVRGALVGTGQELADRPPIPIFQLIQQGGGRCRGPWAALGWDRASPPRPFYPRLRPAWIRRVLDHRGGKGSAKPLCALP